MEVALQHGGKHRPLGDLRVGVGDDLGEELICVAVFLCVGFEVACRVAPVLAGIASHLPAPDDRCGRTAERLRVGASHIGLSNLLHLLGSVEPRGVELLTEGVQRVRVDVRVDGRSGVVALEVLDDHLRVVDEVHHHRGGLVLVDAVKPRECLNGGDTG